MKWGYFFLLLLLLALLVFLVWVIWVHLQARKAGLPPPSWRRFVPFSGRGAGYGYGYRDQDRTGYYPTPRGGGITGWWKDKTAALWPRKRNARTMASESLYETNMDLEAGGEPRSQARTRAARGGGAGDDEAWDARVGGGIDGDGGLYYDHYNEPGSGGAYEPQHVFGGDSMLYSSDPADEHDDYLRASPLPRTALTPDPELHGEQEDEPPRGRSRSRDISSDLAGPSGQAAQGTKATVVPVEPEDPFGDHAGIGEHHDRDAGPPEGEEEDQPKDSMDSVHPVSPRPMVEERRGLFREDL